MQWFFIVTYYNEAISNLYASPVVTKIVKTDKEVRDLWDSCNKANGHDFYVQMIYQEDV